MNFIKKNIKIITAFVLGVIVTSGVVGATVYQYQANDIKYGNTTVGAAVGDLYANVNAQDGGSYGLKVDQLVYSNTNTSRKSYTCPNGKTCLAYIVSTDNRTYVQIGSYGYTMGHYTNNTGYVYENNYVKDTFLIPGGTTLTAYYENDYNSQYGYVMVYTLK